MQVIHKLIKYSNGKNRHATNPHRQAVKSHACIQRLTLMLTEQCNLDCWMCDFARSKGLRKRLPFDIDAIVALLNQTLFRNLQVITLTGGEPFMHPQVVPLFECLQDNYPRLQINISSNGSIIKPMHEAFSKVTSWSRVALLTSIDGLSAHDEQRGTKNAFLKTTETLSQLRGTFPQLRIIIKFTVTQNNYHEIEQTCRYFAEQGFTFTAKAVENNPFYTNKLNNLENYQNFGFTSEHIVEIRRQLNEIIAYPRSLRKHVRLNEIQELHDSLEPGWHRCGKCLTPLQHAFIDADLNLFTCKEFPPICNISDGNIKDIENLPRFMEPIHCEENNSGPCTRCTSQMKIQKRIRPWEKSLKLFRF